MAPIIKVRANDEVVPVVVALADAVSVSVVGKVKEAHCCNKETVVVVVAPAYRLGQ